MAFDSTQLDIVIAAKFLAGPAFEQAKAGMEGIRQSQERMVQGMAQANSALGLMKTALAAIPFAAAYQQLSALHDGTVKLAASINDQAEALGLSTRHYQALSIAARNAGIAEGQMASVLSTFNAKIGEAVAGKKEAIEAFDRLGIKLLDSQKKLRAEGDILREVATALAGMSDVSERTAAAKTLLGISGSRLTGVLKELAGGYEGMADKAEKAGQILDQQTIDVLAKLDRKGSDLSRTFQVLYAQLAAPVITSGLETFNEALAKLQRTIDGLGSSWLKLPAALTVLLGVGGGAGAALIEGRQQGPAPDSFQAEIDRLEKMQRDLGPNNRSFAARAEAIERLRAQQRAAARGAEVGRDRDILMSGGLPPTLGGYSQPGVRATGGGGGAGQRDVLGALEAEARQLELSYDRVMGFSASTTQEMRDQAELADRIAKRLASSLKDVPEGDPRRGQIVALIEQNERYRQGIELRQRAIKEADATEKRYGDGLREHTETMLKLNTALADGLISQDAYAGAVRAANDALQQQRDRVAEARGGIEGFGAGFLSAMRGYERANSTFRTGQQLFEGSVSIMSDALMRFADTGELSFKRILGSFADMLLQMSLKAAGSGLMNVLGGVFQSVIGGLAGGIGGGFGGSFGGAGFGAGAGIGGFAGAFAEGGRPPMGMVSLVGERGPELFVPDTSGTIYNRDQLAAMGGGGGGVSIHQTINIGAAVNTMSRVEIIAALRQTKEETMAAFLDNRRRGNYRGAFA